MDITIFLLTVGEKVTFEALDSIKKYATGKYKVMVWYDACSHNVDWDFYKKLEAYTNDIILSTQNQGLPKTFGYAFLYTDTPYVLLTGADTIYKEKFLDIYLEPFNTMDHVAVVGDCGHELPDKYTVNTSMIPDLGVLFSREAVNAVGAICPSFKLYGQEFSEWCNRAMAKGWKSVTCTGTATHKDDLNTGHVNIDNWNDIYNKNVQLVLKLKDKNWQSYDWWRDDL